MVTVADADSFFDKVFLEQLEAEFWRTPDGRRVLFDSPINTVPGLWAVRGVARHLRKRGSWGGSHIQSSNKEFHIFQGSIGFFARFSTSSLRSQAQFGVYSFPTKPMCCVSNSQELTWGPKPRPNGRKSGLPTLRCQVRNLGECNLLVQCFEIHRSPAIPSSTAFFVYMFRAGHVSSIPALAASLCQEPLCHLRASQLAAVPVQLQPDSGAGL